MESTERQQIHIFRMLAYVVVAWLLKRIEYDQMKTVVIYFIML